MASAAARSAEPIGQPAQKNKTRTKLEPGTLMELRDDGCRFPIGDAGGWRQAFCGKPAGRGPYCVDCAPRTRIAGSAMTREEAAYWAAVAAGAR